MEVIKKFKQVILILGVVIVLVIFRMTGNHFKPDAGKWAASSADGSNIITREQLSKQLSNLPGEKFIITLDETVSADLPNATKIPAANLPEPENLKRIRKNKGPVILYSIDPSFSAGVWMVLSQMGIRNVYILAEDSVKRVR